jgi:poly(3-hydroxyalkanoate) synthetase
MRIAERTRRKGNVMLQWKSWIEKTRQGRELKNALGNLERKEAETMGAN